MFSLFGPHIFFFKCWKYRNPLPCSRPNTATLLVLLLCGDVELNPGPGHDSVFPCGLCNNHVGWSPAKGVQCENPQCNMWYHASCISMPSSDYHKLDPETSWYCFHCNSFNVDSFSYHAYNIPVKNSFTPLFNMSTGTFERTMSVSSPGMPRHFSSPVSASHASPSTRQKLFLTCTSDEDTPEAISADTPSGHFPMDLSQHLVTPASSPMVIGGNSPTPNIHSIDQGNPSVRSDSAPTTCPNPSASKLSNLRVAVGNSNSARRKKAEITNFLDYTKPDVFLITETKLDGNVFSPEFLPDSYKGEIRKDRNLEGGGVMIAYKKELDLVKFEIHNNNAESIWGKLIIRNHPPIIIGAYYRQDSISSMEQIDDLDSNLDFICQRMGPENDYTLMLGGDFNLPDINWQIPEVPPGSKHVAISNKLLEVASKHSLEQQVKIPTRNENTLDLLFTNKPGLIKEVSTVPGISPNDHDIVIIDTFLTLKPNLKAKHKINLWSKANWDFMRNKALEFQEQFLSSSFDSVDSSYKEFTNFIEKLIQDHVPTKFSSNRNRIPWMTTAIRRLCRKKNNECTIKQEKTNHQPHGVSIGQSKNKYRSA